MKKYYLTALLSLGMFAAFSQIHEQDIVHLSILPPINGRDDDLLATSSLIPVQKGDVFTITPDVDRLQSKHHFLKSILKTLSIGALTYQAQNKMAAWDGDKTAQKTKAKNWMLPVEIGIAAGLPDALKGFKKSKNPSIIYSFYNRDLLLTSRRIVLLDRKLKGSIAGTIGEQGYLKVEIEKGYNADVEPNGADVKVQRLLPLRGAMAKIC